ncbi:MAG: hypothetical protein ACYSW7_12095 [Planctomycetota bacterium]|jgi:hypothetical protein
MTNTKARHQEIYTAATKALENAGGVREIDNLSQDKRKAVLFSMATSVIATANTTRDTARRNIAKAMHCARFAIMQQADPDRWGGPRVSDKLGRPPMSENQKRQSVSTRLAPGSKELARGIAEVKELPGWGHSVDLALVRWVEEDSSLKVRLAEMGIIVKNKTL